MIDSVIADLERNRKNLDEEFIEWFQLAVDMAEYVGAEIKAPRIPPCFSKFRSNVPTDDHINGTALIQQYYKRTDDHINGTALIQQYYKRTDDHINGTTLIQQYYKRTDDHIDGTALIQQDYKRTDDHINGTTLIQQDYKRTDDHINGTTLIQQDYKRTDDHINGTTLIQQDYKRNIAIFIFFIYGFFFLKKQQCHGLAEKCSQSHGNPRKLQHKTQ